jgi:hypothetical protein
MKTTKLLQAISLALIIAGMTAVNSGIYAKQPGNAGFVANKTLVTYQVNISYDGIKDQDLSGYILILVDGNGRSIAPPKSVIAGIWSYAFQENGPASGVRTARLIKAPHTLGPAIMYQDASIHGTFDPGRTYVLTMVPFGIPDPGNATAIR